MKKLGRRSALFLVLFFASPHAPTPGAGITFLSSEIQNAGLEELRKWVALQGDSSPSSILNEAIIWVSIGALESESGHPHGAWEAWSRAEELCNQIRVSHYALLADSQRGRAAGVCSLVGAEKLALEVTPIHWRRGRVLRSDILFLQTADLPEAQRLHLMGRLRSALSPAYGQDFRAALVSWRVLERVAPQTPGSDYWMGLTFFRQGNGVAAAESFERAVALSTPDPRAVARRKRRRLSQDDDPGFGFQPFFVTSPSQGVGLGVLAFDDRLYDQPRSARLSARLTTRGNYGLETRYTEMSLLRPVQLAILGALGERNQDFFGLGMSSQWPPVGFRSRRWEAAGEGAFQPLEGLDVSLALGYRGYSALSVFPASLAPDDYFYFGVGIGWNNWKGVFTPRSGLRVLVRQEWSQTKALANAFQRTSFIAQGHLSVGSRHALSLSAAGMLSAGTVPYNALWDLMADLAVPGIREYRYLGSQAAAAWVCYRYRLAPWVQPGVFATTAAAGPTWGEIVGAPKVGAGIDFELIFSRTPRMVPRWELGVFAGEWIFQGGARFGY